MAEGWPQMVADYRGIAVISHWSHTWLLVLVQPRIQSRADGEFVWGYVCPSSQVAQGARELLSDLLARLSIKGDPLQLPGVRVTANRYARHVSPIFSPCDRPLVITSPFRLRHRVPLP